MGLLYLIALGFLATVAVAVELSPPRARWPLVLLASVVFLTAFNEPRVLALLGSVTVLAWWVGRRIARCPADAGRRRWATAGIGALVLALLASKLAGPAGALASQVPPRCGSLPR